MTLHAFAEYLKYHVKAKGRHGTHSPFVYKLVDECLLVCNGQSLEAKLRDYFSSDKPFWLTGAAPLQWHVSVSPPTANGVVIIPGIHSTSGHSASWERLVADPAIKMTIDLFHFGLLLSKDEFIEKQHFVLKSC